MKWTKSLVFTSTLFTFLLVAFSRQVVKVNAQEDDSGRTTTILVSYTAYEWWLLSWDDNEIHCKIIVDHEGLPQIEEVIRDCGKKVATYWQTSPPCNQKTSVCKGAYLYLVSIQPAEKEIVVDLPEAVVWVDLEGCEPLPPSNFCPTIPNLLLIGEEPLPNEEIIAINGTYDGQPFTCPGSSCAIPLQPTPMLGSTIEFWADSSYGDSSEHYKAMVRVVDSGVSPAPGGSGWYVDVISTQWVGEPLGGCSRIWQSFPPVGEPPDWLETPDREELIATEAPYYYLAGRLISEGLIDVSECASGGLLPNGYADVCGLEKANPLLTEWQNQFDNQIIEVAKQTNIPAQLLKNLFAQESQFWPGIFRVPLEFGLGQITDNGADSVLLWNTSFYNQFCPLVLAQETCDKGYLGLSDFEQRMLRGATALLAKSDCDDCPTGIDLTQTNFSVDLFANTLLANCAQICQTIVNATGVENAGSVSTYEDLWRYTIANYHAGAGCVAYAIHQAWMNLGSLNWDQVKGYFTETCKGVVPYVEKITEKKVLN